MKKILLVEDDFDCSVVARLILKNWGYKVYEARDFRDVIRLIQVEKLQADLVIVDLFLPLCSGFSIAEYLRTQSNYRFVPIIAITARSRADDHVKALNSGCNSFIAKPYSLDILQRTVAHLLAIAPRTDYPRQNLSYYCE